MTMDFMEALAWQVIGRINELQDGFDDEGFPTNCCPVCCGPCDALNTMISDPVMLNQLSEIILLTTWHVDYWSFWDNGTGILDAAAIKSRWFKEDGSHKAICQMSNGVDESEMIHKAVKGAEA